uniref:phage protein Gp36 family protein n=1 Tax=Serratia fonticola TaxID=47917 RepID=UPI003AFB6F64
MGYATYQDMVDSFGEREVRLLSDRGNLGQPNGLVIEDGLQRADGEIDGYLAGRYTL